MAFHGKFNIIILIGHHRHCLSGNWFLYLANQTMGKECCSWLSRHLWGASAIRSPLKMTAWEAMAQATKTNMSSTCDGWKGAGIGGEDLGMISAWLVLPTKILLVDIPFSRMIFTN